jgi:cell division transport system permease protein
MAGLRRHEDDVRRRAIRAIGEAASSLGRGWRSSLLALLAIVSAVFVLGAFLVVSRTVDEAVARWADAAELSVFLRDEADGGTQKGIEQLLRADPAVQDVRLVSAADASRRFVESFPDLAPLVDPATGGTLPPSVEARLHAEADIDAVDRLTERLRATPGVVDVRVDRQLLASVARIARAARLGGGLLAAILVLAAALAIASVVRLSYVARREEVNILYLLGAPLASIRAPFVAEGALQAAAGTAIALVLLFVAHAVLMRNYAAALGDLAVPFLPVSLTAALMVFGIAIGAGAGFAAVRGERHDSLE